MLVHSLAHCAWVVLDGAPLLLALVVAAAAGAPVWPEGSYAATGFPPTVYAVVDIAFAVEAADAATDMAGAMGCTTNSFSI